MHGQNHIKCERIVWRRDVIYAYKTALLVVGEDGLYESTVDMECVNDTEYEITVT